MAMIGMNTAYFISKRSCEKVFVYELDPDPVKAADKAEWCTPRFRNKNCVGSPEDCINMSFYRAEEESFEIEERRYQCHFGSMLRDRETFCPPHEPTQ
jgi:hypothetical protein